MQVEAVWAGGQICPRICIHSDGIKTLPLQCWKRADIVNVWPRACKVHLGNDSKQGVSPGEGKTMFMSSCRTSSMATIAIFAHRFNTRQRKRQMDSHLAMLVTEGLLHCRCPRVAWKGGTRSPCLVPAVRGALHILLSHLLLALSHLLHNYRGGGTLQVATESWFSTHFRVQHSSTSFSPYLVPLTRNSWISNLRISL